jgi:hypothetical protein
LIICFAGHSEGTNLNHLTVKLVQRPEIVDVVRGVWCVVRGVWCVVRGFVPVVFCRDAYLGRTYYYFVTTGDVVFLS